MKTARDIIKVLPSHPLWPRSFAAKLTIAALRFGERASEAIIIEIQKRKTPGILVSIKQKRRPAGYRHYEQ